MTAPDVVELARRAVACRAWRWVPGMLTTGAMRITRGEWAVSDGPYLGVVNPPESGSADGWSRGWSTAHAESHEWEPDLTDPATLGCLLALVRAAWGDPTLSAAWAARRWYIVTPVRGVGFDALKAIDAPDELSALVAALEAAPVRS